MGSSRKTKAELIAELDQLRAKISTMENASNSTDVFTSDENLPTSELNSLKNSTGVISAYVDSYRKYRFINKAYANLFGIDPNDAIGCHIKEVLGDDAYNRLKPYIEKVLKGEEQKFPIHMELPGGQPIHLTASYIPVQENNGEIQGFLVMVQDVTEQVQIKEKLSGSEAELKSLLENAPSFYTTINADHYITSINKTIPELSMADVLGRSVYDFIEEDYHHIAREAYDNVFASGIAETYESKAFGPDGSTSWYENHVVPIIIDNQVISLAVIGTDITERINARDELARTAREMEIQNGIANILLTTQDEQMYSAVIEYLKKVFGCGRGIFRYIDSDGNAVMPPSPEDGRNKDDIGEMGNMYPPEKWGGNWGEALQKHKTILSNTPHKMPNGHMPIDNSLVSPILNRGEAIGYIHLVNKDGGFTQDDIDLLEKVCGYIAPVLSARLLGVATIIQKVRVEKALEESEVRFEHLFQKAPVGYQSLDEDGNVIEVNDKWLEMLGYTKDETIGKAIGGFLTPEYVALFKQRFPIFKEVGEIRGVEFEMRRKDGSTFIASVDGKISRHEDGSFKQTHCILQDITDRKKAEEDRKELEVQMQHMQKLESLGVLAGGIAHDFNNLLMGVLGHSELALLELPVESPARGNIEQIRTTALRASELTQQMLAYTGKSLIEKLPLDLNALIQEMTHLLDVSVSKTAILNYDLAESVRPVLGDASQLRQIVMNLIINASEAIGENSGRIKVSTGTVHANRSYLSGMYLDEKLPEGEYSFIEVTDTGSGMDLEMRRKIFDPFFSTKFTGRGLGLATVLGIVRGHKGTIRVSSSSGKGSTFRILIPAVSDAVERTASRESIADDSQWHASGLVLVIDDEEPVRDVAKLMLENIGFNVLTACDGIEGCDLFSQHSDEIDIVLLDMTMPKMGGLGAFKNIRKIKPDARVVLCSGYDEKEAFDKFDDGELAGFLKKPYRFEELTSMLKKALLEKQD